MIFYSESNCHCTQSRCPPDAPSGAYTPFAPPTTGTASQDQDSSRLEFLKKEPEELPIGKVHLASRIVVMNTDGKEDQRPRGVYSNGKRGVMAFGTPGRSKRNWALLLDIVGHEAAPSSQQATSPAMLFLDEIMLRTASRAHDYETQIPIQIRVAGRVAGGLLRDDSKALEAPADGSVPCHWDFVASQDNWMIIDDQPRKTTTAACTQLGHPEPCFFVLLLLRPDKYKTKVSDAWKAVGVLKQLAGLLRDVG
ncbi:uncharacterized protein Z519_09411 [Cladophialophora bantiana CBS 173.52]|uniref:Uncharacterized protein n=1 Tax=Cladophialophora bantiana (strain ATCC 10958 / CBS 173.52 / CDC B-1940 / NIH 8579) TaxID=1442370 RepID=A0A0D2EIX6_CLAB1|nr:uncharacterized protein Z519_09411 [Cladophialophora bantiana CBS 173.52]KIW89981.1 hypothetical protein Z519_09411 [Cladophialophora bantiana CBS 173.52]